MMSAAQASSVVPAAHLPLEPAALRRALLLLMSVYTLGFVDRQIINILAEPMKHDLALSDTQLGLLTGLGFTACYALAGLPIARLAERGNRPLIIAASLSVWSAFTLICAGVRSFVPLLLARAGVGLGEGGCVPAAHSLITDYAPREKRASAFATFNMAVPVGTLIGMVLGGMLADTYGWRTAFVVAGAPGIVLAGILLAVLPEPRRGAGKIAQQGVGALAATRHLLGKRTFRFVVAAGTLKALVTYGQAPFVASYIFRNHGSALAAEAAQFGLKSAGLVGIILGLANGVIGLAGAWLGGRIADRYGARDARVYLLMPAAAALIIVPFNVAAFVAGDLWFVFACLTVPILLNALWLGPVGASIQGIAPPDMRATASAFNLLVVNVFGLGLGPLLVGMLSDFLAGPLGLGSAVGVRWALICTSGLGLVTAMLFWSGSRTINRDMVVDPPLARR